MHAAEGHLRAAPPGRRRARGCRQLGSFSPSGSGAGAGGGRALGLRARSRGARASTSVLWAPGFPRAAFMERLSPKHMMSPGGGWRENALPTGGLAPQFQGEL